MGACGGGAIVTFDYNEWIAIYPEFKASVSAPQGDNFFNIATLYLNNEGASPVPVTQPNRQKTLLYMLTAHIAALNAVDPATGQAKTDLVGRISSATEGSVSVATEFKAGESFGIAFFSQTKYGTQFWQATAQYRTFHYRRPLGHGVGGAFGAAGVPGGGPGPWGGGWRQ